MKEIKLNDVGCGPSLFSGRHTIIGQLLVEQSNANGDPVGAGGPRQLPDGRGLVTGVSLKRKLRDLVEDKDGPVYRGLAQQLGLADGDCGICESSATTEKALAAMVADGTLAARHWDVRMFGATVLLGSGSYARSGVATVSDAVSLAPVEVVGHTLTRKRTVGEGDDERRVFANDALKQVVHGVYLFVITVGSQRAHLTGATDRDVALLLRLLPLAYRMTVSEARRGVEWHSLLGYSHSSPMGDVGDRTLCALLAGRPKVEAPASVNDYEWPAPAAALAHLPGSVYNLLA